MREKITQDMLKINSYTVLGELPNPFVFNDGHTVSSTAEWAERRKELYKTAVELQFGGYPPQPDFFTVEALNYGKTQHSYKIHTGTKEHPISFLVKVILPSKPNRPFIIDGDMGSGYFMQAGFVDAAISKDIGWVFFDRTELAHDIANESRGCGAVFDAYPNHNFGTLATWAWGYSRCVDMLEKLKLPQVDLSCIAFTGHSRGGKAAILAGAIDQRARVVNPNEACLGGGGCYRFHVDADYLDAPKWATETLRDIWESNAFWLGEKMGRYVGHESEFPFDTHYLKAMVAPRILFVSEAAGDVWANPIGSWLTTLVAQEVYRFLDAEENLYWYFRAGFHHHKPQDIEMLVNILCHIHDGEPISDEFFRLPFEPLAPIHNWTIPANKSTQE